MWHALKRVASSSAPRRTLPCLPRGIALWLFLICCSSVLSLPHSAAAQTQINVNTIYVLTFSGPVTPVLESYLNQAIREAEAEGASAIILQLDTPGGSVDVTQSIIQNMLASPVPLVVYVAPAGARAGSAGTFITLAAHIAAMAPSTSIGAASPVELGGGDVDSTLADKITNILSADIENLATRRGEAATEWAIAAVQEAAAATAQQALDLGVIDVIANDIDHLIELLEGRTIELPSGPTVLHVTNAVVVAQEMTPIQRALNILVDPSLATILLSLGVLGLIVEIRTPGLNVAGILGVICLILAFYALGQLDANLTGLIFMIIAIALFVAEAFTPTFGVLTAGGLIAFLLGGALLFDTPGIATPWPTLITLAVILGGMAFLISYLALRAQRSPALTGTEGLIGAIGVAKQAFNASETGSIFVQGEWWSARLTHGEVAANEQVRVLERDRMTLVVEPLHVERAAAVDAQSAPAPQSQSDRAE
jgi:membrane-bound serine protease (ClpP class)